MQLQPQITYAGGRGWGVPTLYNRIIRTLSPKLGLLIFHLNLIRTVGPIPARNFCDHINRKLLNIERQTTNAMLTVKCIDAGKLAIAS